MSAPVSCLLALALLQQPSTGVPLPRADGWRLGVGLGLMAGRGEFAREAESGGREGLSARIRNAFSGGVALGLDRGAAGFALSVQGPHEALVVENRAGETFPNHASGPLVYTVEAAVAPLHPVTRLVLGGRLRLEAAAGGGGGIFTADLDNRDDQSLYHFWQTGWSGRARWSLGDGSGFVELRAAWHRTGATATVRRTRFRFFTLGGGLRLR